MIMPLRNSDGIINELSGMIHVCAHFYVDNKYISVCAYTRIGYSGGPSVVW